ncbi:MAG: hypothetical protein AAGN66_00550 [Acidobacteriota bacterium]
MKSWTPLVLSLILLPAAPALFAEGNPSSPACDAARVPNLNFDNGTTAQPVSPDFEIVAVKHDRLKLRNLDTRTTRWYSLDESTRIRSDRAELAPGDLEVGQRITVRYRYPAFTGKVTILEVQGRG